MFRLVKSIRQVVRALYTICYALRGEASKQRTDEALDCSLQELGEVEQYLGNLELKFKK